MTDKKLEAEQLYAQLLDAFPEPRQPDQQAFLNGYHRCLMVFIPEYAPDVAHEDGTNG